MISIKITLIALLSLMPVFLAAQELMKTQRSWDGELLEYPKGQAEITSQILHLDEGQIAPFHCHPIPTMGYVLNGSIEVETRQGQKIIFHEGDSAVEVMGTIHRGRAVNGPVDIIVFYAGAAGIPTTVFPEDDGADNYCRE